MKMTFTIRDYKNKRWPVLAECIPLGYSGVFATVQEALAALARRFGDVEIVNISTH